MIKIISTLLILIFISSIGSAVLISDQGNNVRFANGTLLDMGDLTISIYDDPNAGNMIFSTTLNGAIVNGSWNLMINPDIQYGQIYWKDYEINGEDLDFDSNERLQFQSSSGLINNVSFLNFSMIGSCSSGSAIRAIYSNGSVECEFVVSGGVDLTNYALKNQSEIFAGNITTSDSGLFGFLGSLASRITKLFVRDIDASGNIDVAGNVSATYILGDGSLLTNLPSAGAESDPIFVAENSTLWASINSRLSSTDQRYNDTVLILGLNSSSNIRALGFYNISEVNAIVAGISGGNSSFNQSLTDILYYSISNPLNFVNTTSNETALILSTNSSLWSYISSNFANWNVTSNETVLISAVNSTLWTYINNNFQNWNSTSNETTFILGINSSIFSYLSSRESAWNFTSNETALVVIVNSSIWNYINANQALWNSTFNSTYQRLLGAQCPSGYFVNGTLLNGTLICSQSAQSESDPLWSANASSVLYVANLPLANRTIVNINNVTGFFFNYNQTSVANNYTNLVNSSIVSWADSIFAKIATVFNRTEIQSQYYNKSDIASLGFVNSSSLQSYNETALINSLNQTLSSLKLNISDQRYNETALIIAVNSTNNIMSLGFYNVSQINSLISNAGNLSFNQTLTNSLYYSINNPSSFINSTQALSYNDSILILSVNATLWSYINSNFANWNSTYNSTYNRLLGAQCPSGMVMNGTLTNGTLTCVSVSTGSTNVFNQNLNTTSNVSFANVTGSGGFFSFLGSLTNRIGRIFATDIDVSNNLSVSGNISSQFYFGSLNRSTFPTSSCSGTDKVIGISFNGSVICDTDESGAPPQDQTIKFMNVLAGAVTDTNAPTAERIVGNSQYLVCTNATGYNRFRYGFARSATNGATNAIIYMKYISSPTTTITASSYTNLSTSGDQVLSYTTANLMALSSYYSMDDNLDDICIGAFQRGGDGALDPQWRNIWVELSST